MFIVVRELLGIVAIGVALCSLDDLLVDGFYLSRLALRKVTIYRSHPRASAERLTARAQPMAILVPAWREGAVIGDMLRHTLRTIDYPAYHIFVGVYPNDPETRRVVDAIGDPRVETVVNKRGIM